MRHVLNTPDLLVEKFEEAAEGRGDDPDAALERLMLEYVRQSSTIAELFAGEGEPVTSLDDYDAGDERLLGYDAAEALPSYEGTPQIDPDDVTEDELPQYRDVKREVILGVLRYRWEQNCDEIDRRHEAVVRRDEVVAAAEAVLGDIGKDDDYKRDEYVEQVMDELLIRNPGDERMAFFSASGVMEYLESLEAGDHKPESDVYHLSQLLAERYQDTVDIDTVNDVRSRFRFGPLE